MMKITAQYRRSLYLVADRCFFFHSRAYELTNQLEKIRGFLHDRLRTATIRNVFEGQPVQ